MLGSICLKYNIAKVEDFHKVSIENKQNYFKFTLSLIKTQTRLLFETMVL